MQENHLLPSNERQIVYLALGSNLGSPMHHIHFAIEALKQLADCRWITISNFYRTKPLGGLSQNDYLNAVACIETVLMPEALLDKTQAIELAAGRVRTDERFASRTLDIDILLYGNQIINSDRLTVPHHGLLTREFMLYPLYDIAPDLILPDNQLLKSIVARTDKNGMQLWDSQD